MIPRTTASVLLAGGLMLAVPAPAAAQVLPARVNTPASRAAQPQIWASFAPLRDSGRWLLGGAAGGRLRLPGVVSFGRLQPWLVAEAGAHYSGAGTYAIVTVLGGFGATLRTRGRVAPFGQFVMGLERCCGENAMAFQPGGGIDYWLTPMFAVRGQIDFRIARYSGENFNETRLAFGVVVPFCGR